MCHAFDQSYPRAVNHTVACRTFLWLHALNQSNQPNNSRRIGKLFMTPEGAHVALIDVMLLHVVSTSITAAIIVWTQSLN